MNFRHLIERDKTILELESNVFSKIQEMTKDDVKGLRFNTKNLNMISFEDALKELLELEKK